MSTVRIAQWFGTLFLVAGVLGFVPAAAPDNHLFGLFHVNTVHNAIHIFSGLIALGCAKAGPGAARTYFQVFGIVYGLVAVLGLVVGDGYLLGLVANNHHDVWLHFLIAAISLYVGFVYAKSPGAASTTNSNSRAV